MAYQSLYRAWRPKTFSEMVGQEAIVRALSNQAAGKRVAHAYLFCGSRGTGKTSAARIMAMAINCEHPDKGDPCLNCQSCQALMSETTLDVFEMDAASNSRVEEIRDMLSRTDYPPQFVKYKVYIIDEVHMLSNAAFNALLKTLEEPPEYMVFILATTEPQKLPATILSRCQRYDFGRIAEQEIINRLKQALVDGLSAEEGALRLIAAAAQGSMRDAWSLMDMCLGAEKHLTQENVRLALGTVSEDFLFEFARALLDADTATALILTDRLMKGGRDVQVFLREFNAHLRQVLAVKWTGSGIRDMTPDQEARFLEASGEASADTMLFILEQCMQAEQESRWSMSPRAVLELFVLRSTQLRHREDLSALLARIGTLESRIQRQADATPRQTPIQTPIVADKIKESTPEQISDDPKPLPDQISQAPADESGEHVPQAEAHESTEQIAFSQPSGLPLANASDTAMPTQRTPKEAWNRMLKCLEKEHAGLYAMVNQGKYGGFQEQTFFLMMGAGDSIYVSLLNAEERSGIIARLLSDQMGQQVFFKAGKNPGITDDPYASQTEEHLTALAKVFGRDKIVLKKE
ncbi:MAG: DNA polymerase III subunit gamma/tau [Christensenellales bacterium]